MIACYPVDAVQLSDRPGCAVGNAADLDATSVLQLLQ